MNNPRYSDLIAAGYLCISAVVGNPLGLHARPSMEFVDMASAYDGRIYLVKGNGQEEPVIANGRSIMEIMMAAIQHNSEVHVLIEPTEGTRHEEFGRTLKNFLERRG